MKARFSFALIIIASAMVSGCVAYPYNGGYAGTDDLMTWAQGAGGDTRHERRVRCTDNRYGWNNCHITESASSRNVKRGVPPTITNTNVLAKPQ